MYNTVNAQWIIYVHNAQYYSRCSQVCEREGVDGPVAHCHFATIIIIVILFDEMIPFMVLNDILF